MVIAVDYRINYTSLPTPFHTEPFYKHGNHFLTWWNWAYSWMEQEMVANGDTNVLISMRFSNMWRRKQQQGFVWTSPSISISLSCANSLPKTMTGKCCIKCQMGQNPIRGRGCVISLSLSASRSWLQWPVTVQPRTAARFSSFVLQ